MKMENQDEKEVEDLDGEEKEDEEKLENWDGTKA